jgi:Dyp-type peroxidase family
MTILELDNIQGYLIRGYAHMLYSRFAYLQISDAKAAKKWLSESWKTMTTAKHIRDKSQISNTHLNIAFTHDGLKQLGLNEENLAAFSREFRQGMVSPHRARLLGDSDLSSPESWIWGGPQNEPIHLCLMVFGNDKSGKDDLEMDKQVCLAYYAELESKFEENGLKLVYYIDGQTQPQNKEHFGFRDGISQPIIEGSGRVGPKDDVVKAGEFLFGYKNEFGVYPDTPLLASPQGDLNLLDSDAEGSGQKDLGKDGTLMVMRQLDQDVNKFWTFMNENTKNPDGSINEAESAKLAAKIMGRWQNGAPITLFPDKDPGPNSDINEFGYAKFDKDGLKCPFGSHLRRSNPRDSVDDHGAKESLKLSKQHRIIRRARLYGQIYEGSPTDTRPDGDVGLLFICFNIDISRQFEFLQYTWANLPKNKELYNDPDPIIGGKERLSTGEQQNFTIQDLPVSRSVKNLPRVITVKGGAYFFLPSINSLRFLSTI